MRLSRRLLLGLMAGTAALPAGAVTPVASASIASSDLRVFILADLHSAYERLGQTLAAIDKASEGGTPSLILVNGDVFEYGNVVARRSQGVIDWTFLKALRARAPLILNIGNHEPDLVDDLANVVAQARAIGITVLSNIRDARTGQPYTDANTTMKVGDKTVSIVGLATNALATYPKAIRPTLDIPEPVAWARDNLPAYLEPRTIAIVMSHAGVVADRITLPLLPDGTLLVGGHDHLLFEHASGRTRYFHTGSWSTGFTIATIRNNGSDSSIRLEGIPVSADAPSSPELAGLIDATLREHLKSEERAVMGRSPTAQPLGATGRAIAKVMAENGGGSIGFVAHTALGTGFPAGEVTKYAFDAVVRFDGDLMAAEVDEDTFKALLAVANQDEDIPLERRRGDFVYAWKDIRAPTGRYIICATDWVAANQQMYFGRGDLKFMKVEGARLKSIVAASLEH